MNTTDGDLFSFLSQGSKLYIQQFHSVFWEKNLKDIKIINVRYIDTVQEEKFDLVILSDPYETSLVKKSISLLSETGYIVFCAQNENLVQRIIWQLKAISLKLLLKRQGLPGSHFYYISPGFEFTVQVISGCRFLSQQYFRQHYHWKFTTQQSFTKRLIKHLVFKTNTFYLLEQSVILGFQKC